MTAALPLLGAAASVVSIGSTILGAGASLAGDAAETSSAMALADYRTEVAKKNSATARENASRAIDVGQVNQYSQDLQTAGLKGDQVAAQAASGIDLNSGSFIRTRKTTAMLGRLDALNVRQAADLEAYGYQQQATDFDSEAKFLQDNKTNTLIAGSFGAVGTIAGAAGSIANALSTTNTSSWALNTGLKVAGGALG